MTDSGRLVRMSGTLGAAWGGLLVVSGPRIWRALTGARPTESDELLTRALGARHVAQGIFQAAAPMRGRRLLAAVDVTHAVSMVALATGDRSRRRPALVSAAVAVASAWALLRGLPRTSSR